MKMQFLALALGAGLLTPAVAEAATGYATADVNLRGGPGTNYPVIDVIPDNARVTIYGCIRGRSWCDVGFAGARGWMSENYLQANYGNRRIPLAAPAYRSLGIPGITFSFGSYWNRHYRDRSFYHNRHHWDPRHHDGRHRDDRRRSKWWRDHH
jgi:uncharacterized protein YraI